jgi:hypothetical protein
MVYGRPDSQRTRTPLNSKSNGKKTKPYWQPVPAPFKDRSWEKWITIITVIFDGLLFAATCSYVYVSDKTLSQIRAQASVAAQTLELSQRPWIAEEVSITLPLTFNDKSENGGGAVTLSLKNVGHSVAINVHPFCNLDTLKNGESFMSVENKSCNTLSWQTEQDASAGYMMFPDEPFEYVQSIAIGKKALTDAALCILVWCVDYRFAFESRHHQTRREYIMGIHQPWPSLGLGRIIPQGTVKDLALIQVFSGNSAN